MVSNLATFVSQHLDFYYFLITLTTQCDADIEEYVALFYLISNCPAYWDTKGAKFDTIFLSFAFIK